MNVMFLMFFVAIGNGIVLKNEVLLLEKLESESIEAIATENVGELIARIEKKLRTSIVISAGAKRSGILDNQFLSSNRRYPPLRMTTLLTVALQESKFRCIVKDGKITIVRNHKALVFSRLHDMWAIAASAQQQLPDLAQNIMNRDEWKQNGGDFSIRIVGKKLLVSCNETTHEQIDTLLQLMRLIPDKTFEKTP